MRSPFCYNIGKDNRNGGIAYGFSVPASDVADAENDVTEWLDQLGF